MFNRILSTIVLALIAVNIAGAVPAEDRLLVRHQTVENPPRARHQTIGYGLAATIVGRGGPIKTIEALYQRIETDYQTIEGGVVATAVGHGGPIQTTYAPHF